MGAHRSRPKRLLGARDPKGVATYEGEGCSGRLTCDVWSVATPCKQLSMLSSGCWARSPKGCRPSGVGRSLNASWKRLSGPQSASQSLHACLSKAGPELGLQCSSRRAYARGDGVEAAFVRRRSTGSCSVSRPLFAFQIPRPGACFSAALPKSTEPSWRYRTNHGHQAELLVPMVDDAVGAGWAPEVLHWGWELSHWITQLLPVLMPFTKLVRQQRSPSHLCRSYAPLGSHGGARRWWLREQTPVVLMRTAVLRHCGLAEVTAYRGASGAASGALAAPASLEGAAAAGREAEAHGWSSGEGGARGAVEGGVLRGGGSAGGRPPARTRVVVLLRGDSQQRADLNQTDGDELRSFSSTRRLLAQLAAALPNATVVTAVTSGRAPLCAQARWVHGASLLVSPHGAHLTNALWLPRGSLLLEVMPWGMWDYEGYAGLLRGGGVAHERLGSRRPPPGAPHWNASVSEQQQLASAGTRGGTHRVAADGGGADGSARAQRACAEVEGCRRFYRAHSRLHVTRATLCKPLRRHFAVARVPGSVCYTKRAGGTG